jgi:hypothetical protein
MKDSEPLRREEPKKQATVRSTQTIQPREGIRDGASPKRHEAKKPIGTYWRLLVGESRQTRF